MTKHDLLNDIHARVVRLETIAEQNKEVLSDMQKKVNHLEHLRGVIAILGGTLGAVAGLIGTVVLQFFNGRNT
jgi:hypothetical protein